MLICVLRGLVSMIACLVVKWLSGPCCPILLAVSIDASVQRDTYFCLQKPLRIRDACRPRRQTLLSNKS